MKQPHVPVVDAAYGKIKQLLLGIHRNDALGSHTNWNVVKHGLGQLLLHRLDITLIKVSTQQPYTTVDVKANTTCQRKKQMSI